MRFSFSLSSTGKKWTLMSSSASPNKKKTTMRVVPSGISRTAYKKSGAMQDGGIGRY
jgi:hypothetical protein